MSDERTMAEKIADPTIQRAADRTQPAIMPPDVFDVGIDDFVEELIEGEDEAYLQERRQMIKDVYRETHTAAIAAIDAAEDVDPNYTVSVVPVETFETNATTPGPVAVAVSGAEYPDLTEEPEITPRIATVEQALHDALEDYSFDTIRMAVYAIAAMDAFAARTTACAEPSEPAEAQIEADAGLRTAIDRVVELERKLERLWRSDPEYKETIDHLIGARFRLDVAIHNLAARTTARAEPSEAEIEATARSIWNGEVTEVSKLSTPWDADVDPRDRDTFRRVARAAILAARNAGQGVESHD